MTRKQRVFLSVAALILCSMLFFIIFSEHGFIDLKNLKNERDQLVNNNKQLTQKNLSLSTEIDRLKHDPEYIENVARRELGMVRKDELIIKPQHLPKP